MLDAQGEVILAGEVRYFAKHLPPVFTDRQRLSAQFLRFKERQRQLQPEGSARADPNDPERTLQQLFEPGRNGTQHGNNAENSGQKVDTDESTACKSLI